MDRARLKTFVLLLLLTVNLIFLAFLVTDWAQTARQRSEIRAELIDALHRMGITMAYEAIPEEGPQTIYFIARDVAAERQVVAALLGDVSESDVGGGIYHYQSPQGQAQFRGGTFWIELADNIYRPSDTGPLLVERMGLWAPTGSGDGSQLTHTLAIDRQRPDQLVINGQVTFHFVDGYVREISGTALWGTWQSYLAGQQQNAATALITLAGYLLNEGEVSRFERMEMGYYLLEGSGYLELRPAWIVITDGGIFSVDRQSGEVRSG